MRWRIVRLTQKTFTVSAGAIVFNQDGKILLLEHYLRPKNGWGIPGGFMNRGEQPEDAVRREIMEEVGLEIGNVKLVRAETKNRHVEFLFRAEADGEPKISSREIKTAGWFALDAMPEEMSWVQEQIIEKALKSDV